MGGFSDNYECGYWGDEAPPLQRNKKTSSKNKAQNTPSIESYIEIRDTHYRNLKIVLTPIKLLTPEQMDNRINLCQTCNMETELEILHRKENPDKKTLELFYDELSIGFVQKVFEDEKVNHAMIVNDFCFENNTLKAIEALWDGEDFWLRTKLA